MKKLPALLPLTLAALVSLAGAQTAQDIINKVDATQKAAKDVSFRVTGTATFESASQKIDMTVKALPSQSLARIAFAAPDALADNIIVADKNEVRQFIFLTNQITVTPIKKAATNAGFTGLDFTKLSNTASMLADYTVKLVGTTGSAGNRVFQLEATPKKGADMKARMWVTEAGWRPTKLQMLNEAGKLVADLSISNYKVNSGLSAASLRALPKDAEIIRQ